MSEAQTVFCLFRVRRGKEEELLGLCRDHDQTLRRLGLCTDKPAQVYRGGDELRNSFIFKIFEWKSGEALDAARKHPDVQILWEAMEPCCEQRGGQPSMEFPHVVSVDL